MIKLIRWTISLGNDDGQFTFEQLVETDEWVDDVAEIKKRMPKFECLPMSGIGSINCFYLEV